MEWLGKLVETTATVHFRPLNPQAHFLSEYVVPGIISTVPNLCDINKLYYFDFLFNNPVQRLDDPGSQDVRTEYRKYLTLLVLC